MGWTDHDPVPMPGMPEAPRDPSIDSQLEEPAEREAPRARDVAMNMYLCRIENLKAALRRFLQAGDAVDRMRARSLGAELLQRMDDEDVARMRR